MLDSYPSIAFAGLGLMGLPMSSRLLAAGYPLTVWNRSAEKCLPLLERGAHRVESPGQLCASAEIVMRQLPAWFDHYNRLHPHKALGYRSPREFIADRSTTEEVSGL